MPDTISTAPTLLVITDSRVRSLFALLFRDMGWEVESCPDPLESSERVRTKQYTLILFSTDQAVCDCRDLIRQYRHYNPGAALIALSIKEQMEQVLKLFPLGLTDALIQPYNPRLVLARLREILEEHERKGIVQEKPESAPHVDRESPPDIHPAGFSSHRPVYLTGSSSAYNGLVQQLWNARTSTSILMLTGPAGSEYELIVREWMHMGGDRENFPIVLGPGEIQEDTLNACHASNRLGTSNPLTLHISNVQLLSTQESQALLRFLTRIKTQSTRDRMLNVIMSWSEGDDNSSDSMNSIYEELLYFVNSNIEVPSLDARASDIPAIARKTLFDLTDAFPGITCRSLDPAVMETLSKRSWPRNYAALKSFLVRAISQCPKRRMSMEYAELLLQESTGDHPCLNEMTFP